MPSSRRNSEKYLAIETAGGPLWHPKENMIVFAYDAPGMYQVYSVPIKKGLTFWPTRMTFEEDRCTAPRYLPDGGVVFSRDRGGNENFQIGHIGNDYDLKWLTSDLEAKHRINAVGEKRLYYMANIDDKSRLDIYYHEHPVLENEGVKIFEPEEGIVSVDTLSDDENKIVLHRFRGNVDHELLLWEDGDVSSITGELQSDITERWNAIRFVDSETLLVATDYGSDLNRLALLGLNGDFQQIVQIEEKLEHPMEEAVYVKQSATTFFFNNQEGYSSLYAGEFKRDGVEGLREIELPIDGTIVSGDARSFSFSASLSPEGARLAVTLSSPTEATNIWVCDTEVGGWWKATDVSLAGLNPKNFVDATHHRFESFDGLSVPYFKYVPRGHRPDEGWPALFIIHGGPESQIRPSFQPVIQFYLSAGYAVVTPNIRGSTGYGRMYMDLDNVEKRLDSIEDIKSLATRIEASDGDIDGTRLVVYGGSYGGFAVLSSITEHPDIWKAGVDIVGISNFVTFLKNTADWRRPLREAEYGSLSEDRATLERISPINQVDRISCPLFIIQGDNDERVPLSESIQIYEQVKSKGIPVKMLRFSDEGHGLAKLANRIQAYCQVLEWLDEVA
ncbi:S9 family peptidase [Candidatus Thorarchaeota archaeon]|nr:MAG: S9 family peptidase [Candidatus Thorarchaeota archaeon]